MIHYVYYSFGALAALYVLTRVLRWLHRRLELSLGKNPGLAGHPRLARRLSRLVPFYAYDDERVLNIDNPPSAIAERRRASFTRLVELYGQRFPRSQALTAEATRWISDLQLTANYRVPFQFRRFVARQLKMSAFIGSSAGVTITDLDGNRFYDLTGSYGVNVFGYDFYKECIDHAVMRARDLGPVLGAYHPVVADNARRLCEIAGLEEVSFHMSGTEAVMQAVRLARFHTRRTHIVRFCGAYHGWWDDVQPGVGNPLPAKSTYTLKEMSEAALRVLRKRNDIACVLVNPLQALHPNAEAPSDSTLLGNGRQAHFDRQAYSAWLKQLREICTQRNIVLIFDEVFLGFRLARGGAQEYFGVRADMVTYGKTLGGGLPIGALCGRREFMKRFRDDKPADICFARGTFNSHPYVMTAMAEFLQRLETEEVRAVYRDLDACWDARAERLNDRLAAAQLPVRVVNLSTIWTLCYTKPCRYNWMLQYYLRAEQLALSWVGTGRLIFSLNFTDTEFEQVADRFVAAARAMDAGGWWWTPAGASDRGIRRSVLREMLTQKFASRRKRQPAPQWRMEGEVDSRRSHQASIRHSK
jgi:glutamate-1-semialdehyde 2,1-aminomutase